MINKLNKLNRGPGNTGWIALMGWMTALSFLFSACKKDAADDGSPSSIKLIPTQSEQKQLKAVASRQGNILVFGTSGDLVVPAVRHECFLLNPSGEVIRKLPLSDSIYQYMNAVPSLGDGFVVCAASNGWTTISLFEISNLGDIRWSRSIACSGGTSLNEPAVATYDQEYQVLYQSYGVGYYIWKGDAGGNELLNKRIPTPNVYHYGSGLNFGEKMVRLVQANDTLMVIQGITYDQYEELIENCFVRAVSGTVAKKWYSDNYDSTRIERVAAMDYSMDHKIILFGSKSAHTVDEGFGDVFVRAYSPEGTFLGDVLLPRVGGTPNTIKHAVTAPDGGYLLVGSNNQLPINDIVSPNRMILIKLNQDRSLSWAKEIPTSFPAKGFDAVYLKDGSIGLLGLMKENYAVNKALYVHLDATGDIINN